MNKLNEIKSERGDVANIHIAFLDFEAGMSAHYEFYKAIILNDNLPLSRAERECLAMHTSKENECPYCIAHHKEAFEVSKISLQLDVAKLEVLKELSYLLTKEPWKANIFKKSFLKVGYSEAQWQHAVMVIGYFNFVNRCAHAQDVKLEKNFNQMCK